MNAIRLPDETDWHSGIEPGSFWRREGVWYAITPNGLFGNLKAHTVTEHEDGTITVSPSILVTYHRLDGGRTWHGYLEHGVWRAC